MKNENIQPAWLTLKGAAQYSGLSVRLLQELVRENYIVSSAVIRPEARRGRRLVCRHSLDAWIERGIGGACNVPF